MKLKLFHYQGVRSSRVKWLLHELFDDNFELELVDLYKAEQYAAPFVDINPNHAVPLLQVTLPNGDPFNVIESGAITTFLADSFSEKNLAPAAGFSPERAEYLQMIFFACATFDMALWQIRVHTHVLRNSEKDERVAQRYREKIVQEIEPQLLQRLEKQPFICGEFSAADCVMGHCVMWAQAYGLCTDVVFAKYVERLSQRIAFQKAYSDAYLFEHQVPESSPALEYFSG
ncbi:glutathione S-transferase [[Pantoea] beijingensis]|uniref:Glutathione S-transferase n=1 Tax=[Pantoea] beijingensis TaxID=1324864 RepID=A0A443IHM3_9GAMM|nr:MULTISPECIES: glutathione S-transferase family protein [Erwiniaceae]RWR03598.1 glutathione S-transferase [[Pantoea] beijingensis]